MEIIIYNTSETPIYEQIAGQIKGLILSGELKSGEALPSLRLLAKNLRVSVITTKRAYEELEQEGYIRSVPGKGCFVSSKSSQLLEEERLRVVEEKLAQVVETARKTGVSLEKMQEILETLYEEEQT
ncbi:MAG TPA: GntR family transcriptional regulator [Candidatus Scatomonas pullistercoris]|uniref:GntR family transcriptional regulator n=1 Tax=Candidatus Scatomonas pullistercoris TaxID=2840920 RepID=A0A9D1T9U6_9FIRM|nr:GntR family transcriptional regulator [Candidatus Scatomonas pullistercoris]